MGAIWSMTKSNRLTLSKQPDWFLSQGYKVDSISKINILELDTKKDSIVDRSKSPLKELSSKGSTRRLSDAGSLPRSNSGASNRSLESMLSIEEFTGTKPARLTRQKSFKDTRRSFALPPKDSVKEKWRSKWKTTSGLEAT
eukprot:751291-Hanusia_phi.AAC.1